MNKKSEISKRYTSFIITLAIIVIQLFSISSVSHATDEEEVVSKIQSEIPGGEYMDFEGEAGTLTFPVKGVIWDDGTEMLLNNIAGPFNESEREEIRADFVEYAQSLGENVSMGSVTSFQGYKVMEFVQMEGGQETGIGWMIEYESHIVYNAAAVEMGTSPSSGGLRSRIENLSTVSLKAMAEQGYVPSEKSGEEGSLNLEEMAGEELETPESGLEKGVIAGTTETGSRYEPNSSGDVFEGGVWNSSQGDSDFLERRFDSPTQVSEIRIERAGTDVTTENSSLTMKLQTPDGNWITVDRLQDTNINITSLTGGAEANSISGYSKVLDEPVEAIAFRLEMTGNGWFMAENIEVLSGTIGVSAAPAGIGSVGNIPGPENASEAVAGVVIPGIMISVLGNLVGMAGTGGLSPNGAPEIFVDGIEEGLGPVESDEIYYSLQESQNEVIREEFELEEFDSSGYDIEGYNRDGYDRDGFDREGYDIQGFDRRGYDDEGFDRAGMDTDGFNREGYSSDGYDRDGYDRGGYNIDGYDRDGYDRDGYDSDGYDRDGYDSGGYNSDGYDKDGYNRDGYDGDGYDRGGYDSDGYDKNGYNSGGFDRDGIRKDGYDSDGYDRGGYNYEGYDRDGFDRDGYNRDGYDRDGYNRGGYDREGYGADGYSEDGYNRDGYDRDGYGVDGYSVEGLDRVGYDREGYNLDGYNRDGYDRDGFDSEGYGADGYDREGYSRSNHDRFGVHRDYKKKSSSEAPEGSPPPPSEPGGPLPGRWEYRSAGIKIGSLDPKSNTGTIDPAKVKNPFQEEFEWVWVTGDKAETKVDMPEVDGKWENPIISTPDGDYDPRDGYLRFPPESGGESRADQSLDAPELEALEQEVPEEMTLVDSLGKEHTYVKDPESGEYINIETGGQLDRTLWNEWNSNLKSNRDWADEQMRKLESGDTANDRALREFVEDQKLEQKMQDNLAKMRRDIMERKDGTGMLNRGDDEPGDVITKIDKVMEEAEKSGELNREDYEKIRRIYQKARNKEIIPESESYKPSDWETMEALVNMTEKTAKEVITGADEEGNISVLGIGARILISVATLGGSEMIFTPADVLLTTKRLVDEGKTNADIAKEFLKQYVSGKIIGKIGQIGGNMLSKATKKLANYGARKLPYHASKLQQAKKWVSKQLSREINIRPKAKPPIAGPKIRKVSPRPSSGEIKERLAIKKAEKSLKAKAGLEIDEKSFTSTGKKPDMSKLSRKEQIGIKLASERNHAKIVLRPKSANATKMLSEGKAYPKPEKLKIKSIKGDRYDLEFGYSKNDVDKVMLKKPKMPNTKGRSSAEVKQLQSEYKKRMVDYNDAKVDLEELLAENPNIKWNKKTGEITCNGKPFVGDNDAFAFVDARTEKPLPPEVTSRINRDLQQYGVTVHKEHIGWNYSNLKNSKKVYPSGKTPYQKAKGIDKKILGEDHVPGVSDDKALISYSPDGDFGDSGWDTLNYTGGLRSES